VLLTLVPANRSAHWWLDAPDFAEILTEMDAVVSGRRSPATFVALTFGLSVPFWVLGALVKTPHGVPVRLPLSALQLVTPLIAASILVYRDEGGRGVRRHLRRLVDPGRTASWRKYALIVVVMPTIYALGYVAMRAAGRPVPDPAISLGDVAVLLVLLLVAAAFEEGGWTGYALDPLRDRWGMVRAALTLGFVWAAFHLVADLQGGHDPGWILLHRTGAGALRVLLVVAYFGTGRGMLAAVLMHAMDNLSWQLFPVGGSAYDPMFVAPFTVAAAILVVAMSTRILPRWSAGSLRPG
jgi:membrane protease YdiL (CAAX protease family)